MIKVLFSDLDGTLLSVFGQRNGVTISKANKEAIKKLLNNDVKFCIASGRNSLYIDEVLKELDLINGDVIACNGANTSIEGKKEIHIVNKKTMCEFLNFYYNHFNKDAYRVWAVEADDTYIADEVDTYFLERYEKSSYRINKERDLRDYLKNPDIYLGFQKIMISIKDGNNQKWQDFFIPHCQKWFDIGCPIPKQIEMMKKGVNKGSAIDNYINFYGFTIDEVAAIGDANNDIPMLKKAKYSYVVENGEIEAKQMAYKVVKDVASAIDDILKINGSK